MPNLSIIALFLLHYLISYRTAADALNSQAYLNQKEQSNPQSFQSDPSARNKRYPSSDNATLDSDSGERVKRSFIRLKPLQMRMKEAISNLQYSKRSQPDGYPSSDIYDPNYKEEGEMKDINGGNYYYEPNTVMLDDDREFGRDKKAFFKIKPFQKKEFYMANPTLWSDQSNPAGIMGPRTDIKRYYDSDYYDALMNNRDARFSADLAPSTYWKTVGKRPFFRMNPISNELKRALMLINSGDVEDGDRRNIPTDKKAFFRLSPMDAKRRMSDGTTNKRAFFRLKPLGQSRSYLNFFDDDGQSNYKKRDMYTPSFFEKEIYSMAIPDLGDHRRLVRRETARNSRFADSAYFPHFRAYVAAYGNSLPSSLSRKNDVKGDVAKRYFFRLSHLRPERGNSKMAANNYLYQE
ncbi:unnamed protein product [Gordionus sp. m RMFG-2023]